MLYVEKRNAQPLDDLAGDVRLHLENIVYDPIVGLGPKLSAV